MLRLLRFLIPHRTFVASLVFLNILLSAVLTVAPLVIKRIVDEIIGLQQQHLLIPYLGLLLLVTTVRTITVYFYSYRQNKLGQLVMTDVRTALYKKLLALPYSFYDKEQTGRLMSRISSDVESTRIFLSQILVESMSHTLTITFASIALLFQDQLLFVIAILPIIASGLAMYQLHRKLTRPWLLQHEQMASMSSVLQDSLAGIKVVKAFAHELHTQNKFQTEHLVLRKGNLLIHDTWNIRWFVIGSVPRFMQLGLFLAGGYRVMAGDISLGTLVAVVSLSLLLLGAMNSLGSQLNGFSQTATAATRIFELLDEPAILNVPSSIQFAPISGTSNSNKSHWTCTGEIEYRGIHFAYPNSQTNALTNINLNIPAGSSLAVVGATGSGKTTLIQLIGRFYDPSAGELLVDGHDVRALDRTQLRLQIGIVSQDTLLFSATVAENIAFGRPDVTKEEIELAANIAQAHDFIIQMAAGYQTLIGERGVGLSGGQRQRIAIARALLLDPRILILDDSMSAVDSETEVLLQTAIQQSMKGRTTILVAHRLSTAKTADNIIVLRAGRIVEQGDHQQLANNNGYYQNVLSMQQMSL